MPAVFLQSRLDVGPPILVVVAVGFAVVVVVVGLAVVVGAQVQLQPFVVAAGLAVVTALTFKSGISLPDFGISAPSKACISSLERSVRWFSPCV